MHRQIASIDCGPFPSFLGQIPFHVIRGIPMNILTRTSTSSIRFLPSSFHSFAALACFGFSVLPSTLPAQQNDSLRGKRQFVAIDDETQSDSSKFEALEAMLNQVALRGMFTIDGEDLSNLKEESYEIRSAKKTPDGDLWAINCRIKYGSIDVVLPIIVDIKWAENTPVVTLDELTIPGMGTFSARVVFHDKKYAGTWRHDEVAGHLFGIIEPLAAANSDEADTAGKPEDSK